MMSEAFLPSDDSDDDDIVYDLVGQQTGENNEVETTSEQEGSDKSVDSPAPRPSPIRPTVQRRMSLRVPSLPTNSQCDTTVTKEQLEELSRFLKSFPIPPTVSHDAQHTTTNMIYNNKITDTAVKLVSGIGKFGKLFSSTTTSSSTLSTAPKLTRETSVPSPLHPSYSRNNVNSDRL